MFIYYILIFSKHGHLITGYHPENVTLDYEGELLSGFFSAIQISFKHSYNNPILSIKTGKSRLYFLNDEENNLIYAINCALISRTDAEIFLKKIRDIINEGYNIDGDKPCYFPIRVYDEINEILDKETKKMEERIKDRYYVPANEKEKPESNPEFVF